VPLGRPESAVLIGAHRRHPASRAIARSLRELYAPSPWTGGFAPPFLRSAPVLLSSPTAGPNAALSPVRSSVRTATSILLVRVPTAAAGLWLSLLPTSGPHFSSLPALLLPVERNVAPVTAAGSGLRPGPAVTAAMPPRCATVVPRRAAPAPAPRAGLRDSQIPNVGTW